MFFSNSKKHTQQKQTLYIFNAEHQVIILSSLPKVIVDVSPPTIEVGRLLDPEEDNVELGRNAAMLTEIGSIENTQTI